MPLKQHTTTGYATAEQRKCHTKTKRIPAVKGASTPKMSRLFSMPTELRIRIYECALVDQDKIDIGLFIRDSRKARKEPGLLATCRQIRDEAIKIYYNQNNFVYHAHSFDIVGVLPFCRLLRKYHKDPKLMLKVEICRGLHGYGFGDWEIETLDEWLQQFHGNPGLVPKPMQDTDANPLMARTMAERTFGIVECMLHKPWEKVYEVLMPFYESITHLGEHDSIRYAQWEATMRAQHKSKRRCMVPDRDDTSDSDYDPCDDESDEGDDDEKDDDEAHEEEGSDDEMGGVTIDDVD